jgi:hypothetical protein
MLLHLSYREACDPSEMKKSTNGKNIGSSKPDRARQTFLRDSEGGPVEDDYYTKGPFAVKALFHFLAEHPDEFPLPEKGIHVAESFAGAGDLAREIEKQKIVNKVTQSDLFSIKGEHKDFFKEDLPEGTDIIITNSSWGPTGAKEKTIERCIELGKPACLLYPYSVVGQVKSMKILRRVVSFSYCRNYGKTTSFDIFDKYGVDNCCIVLLEDCPCDSKTKLHEREAFFIKTIPNVNKNIPGRTKKMYCEEHKTEISEKRKEIVVCCCGSKVSQDYLRKHLKSKKHSDMISTINILPSA